MQKNYTLWFLGWFLVGCQTEPVNPSNPAAQKCLQDGYVSKPVLSKGGVCINPKTGKKCQEWSYFLGECQLSNSPTPLLPPSKEASLAAKKCLQEGYVSKPLVSSNGKVTGGVCVNPRLGKRCEEGAYLRGECQLTN